MGKVEIPEDYGYVIFVVVAGFALVQYLAFQVMKARKQYDVRYPKLYSESSHEFNCVQRAHQNTLEIYPQFIVFLLLGGLQFPKLSALFGLICLYSRWVYAQGYYTFKPVNRKRAMFGYIGLVGLIINTIILGINTIGFF